MSDSVLHNFTELQEKMPEEAQANSEAKAEQFINDMMFQEQDAFDFLDSLLDTFSEDQLCLLEQRIFSAIVRKRQTEQD